MTRLMRPIGVFALIFGLSAAAQAQEAAKGTLRSVNSERSEVVIKGIVKDTTYELLKDGSVWLDGKRSKLGDLKADDQATVTFNKQGDRLMAREVRALRNAKEATGTVRGVFKDKREITLKGVVNDTTYELNKDGTVYVDGKQSMLTDLREGDQVLITYEKKGDHWMASDVTLVKRK